MLYFGYAGPAQSAPGMVKGVLESISKHLEASADVDIPPRLWADFTSAAASIAGQLIPGKAVALRVMDDAAIRRLNADFRRVDAATDVLSFPADEKSPPDHGGDIGISWETVSRQARANGNTDLAEAVALFAHGMLHLTGLDHPDDAAQDAFDLKTRELCNSVGIEVETFGH